jgi:hypothetical protein
VIIFENGKKVATFNKQRTEENLDKFIKAHFADKLFSKKPVRKQKKQT